MTELRHRMIADMKLHGLAPGTQKVYVNAVSRLAEYFRRSPDQLTQDEIRAYLLHLKERGLSSSSRNVAAETAKLRRQILSEK